MMLLEVPTVTEEQSNSQLWFWGMFSWTISNWTLVLLASGVLF